MSLRLAFLTAFSLVVASSCKGGSDSEPNDELACGTASCPAGQACCLGCDNQGLCVQPGQACPGVSCAPEDPLICSGTVCNEQDGSCCVDCDGNSTCIGAGAACPGSACSGECPSATEFDQRCETPSDCAIVSYNLDCCGGGNISAVHSTAFDSFISSQAPCVQAISQCPPLGCSAPMLADDGNQVSGPSQVNAVCTDSVCRTVSAF